MIVNIIECDIPNVKAVSSVGEDEGVHNIYIRKNMSFEDIQIHTVAKQKGYPLLILLTVGKHTSLHRLNCKRKLTWPIIQTLPRI